MTAMVEEVYRLPTSNSKAAELPRYRHADLRLSAQGSESYLAFGINEQLKQLNY